MRFVVDSNIFISALLKDGAVRRLLLFPGIGLIAPDLVRSEVLGHMEELKTRSNLTIRGARELGLRPALGRPAATPDGSPGTTTSGQLHRAKGISGRKWELIGCAKRYINKKIMY